MKEKLEQISECVWHLDKKIRPEMRVDAKIYATKRLIDAAEDTAVQQLTNVACLPGVIEPVIAMPDMHWGYGLPMGAVGVFDKEKGVISAGCTGFDINCGVHMLRSDISAKDLIPKLRLLIDTIFRKVPCGVGSKGVLRLTHLEDVLIGGANWAIENGYGIKDDLERMEENGCISGADPKAVSEQALQRGRPQIGTLGAGNHFLEVQKVDKIYDMEIAKAFGIEEGQITIMIHCGSRGFGHQVATDYLRIHKSAAHKYGIKLPDPQLVCAPTTSSEGQAYFSAMKCAVNYAFCNRQVIAHWVRECFEEVFKQDWESLGLTTLYDVCHNICKLEKHKIGGKKQEVYVHRKGATRAFPAGHKDVPRPYKDVGQPVLIAGSMGTASYILVGTEKTMEETFGSSCHGAGRVMSRHAAIKRYYGENVKKTLESKGEVIRSTHPKILAEESPDAYKDVDEVVKTVDLVGISKKIARVVPLGVAKG
jgi:tRNA-splicing ligase RtcB